MRCLNHPDSDASGSCMLCRNFFCDQCLEVVGEHKVCLDCMESMARSSLSTQDAAFLTPRLLAAGTLFFIFGLAAAFDALAHLVGFVQLAFFSRAASPAFAQLLSICFAFAKCFVFFVSGYGVLMSRSWSYLFSLAVSSGTILFELYLLTVSPSLWSALSLAGAVAVLILIATGGNEFATQ